MGMKRSAARPPNRPLKKMKVKETEDDRKGPGFIKFNPERLGSMPLLKGMFVDFDSLLRVKFDVSDFVDSLKLRKLLTVKEPVYDKLVRDFYMNLRRQRNSTLSSVVRNVKIRVDCKLLESLFDLEHVPDGFCIRNPSDRTIEWNGYDDISFKSTIFMDEKVYTGDGNMKPLAKFMHKVIINNLLPKSGSRDKCTIAERVVMWHLLNKKPMNFAQQIIYNMCNRHRAGKKDRLKDVHLPHGNLLTVIFKEFKVPITVNDKKTFCSKQIDARYWLSIATLTERRGWILSKFVDVERDGVIYDNKSVLPADDNEKNDEEMEDESGDHDDDQGGVESGIDTTPKHDRDTSGRKEEDTVLESQGKETSINANVGGEDEARDVVDKVGDETAYQKIESDSDEENEGKCPKKRREHVEVDLENVPSNLSGPMLVVCNWSNDALRHGHTKDVTFGTEVFGHESKSVIFREEIYAVAHIKEINVCTIMCYMSHLFAVLKKENLHESILFVDPNITYAKGSRKTDDDRSEELMRRFQMGREESIFLVPYNTGNHWTLSVVDVHKKVVHWFDPLARRMTAEPGWKKVLNKAVESYHSVKEPNQKTKTRVQWKHLAGFPRQEDGHSCGYFILRYMRDIVYGKGLRSFDKWLKRSNLTYKIEDIDEIRKEWAEQLISLLDCAQQEDCPLTGPTHSAKKLLIFDSDGLLFGSETRQPRPHSVPFLKFCFEKFDVANWSSSFSCPRKTISTLNDDARPLYKHLKFSWGHDKCTKTHMKTSPHSKGKDIVFKDLRNVWKNFKEYNASNTLLIDDEPHRAFLHSEFNSIFIQKYTGREPSDHFLDIKGEFALYLEAISKADSVADVIRMKRFGRSPLEPNSILWKQCTDFANKCKV